VTFITDHKFISREDTNLLKSKAQPTQQQSELVFWYNNKQKKVEREFVKASLELKKLSTQNNSISKKLGGEEIIILYQLKSKFKCSWLQVLTFLSITLSIKYL